MRRIASPQGTALGHRRLGLLLRRFARARKGVAAVEFAIVAAPFIATLMVILEVSYLFLLGETLDNGLAQAAREILTGQAQSSTGSTKIQDQATFITNALCPKVSSVLDCRKLQVNVQNLGSSFSSSSPGAPISGGNLNTGSWGYSPCQSKTGTPDIMKVEAIYPVSALSAYFIYARTVTITGVQTRVLYSSAVFRCEPF